MRLNELADNSARRKRACGAWRIFWQGQDRRSRRKGKTSRWALPLKGLKANKCRSICVCKRALTSPTARS